MNSSMSKEDKNEGVKKEHKGKKRKSINYSHSSKEDFYIEINSYAFDFGFKCLNENYKTKNS